MKFKEFFGMGQKKESPHGSNREGFICKSISEETDMSNFTLDGTKSTTKAKGVGWLRLQIEKGQKQRFAEFVVLTPSLASALLSMNEGNRSVKGHKVEQYARDMSASLWELNGETMSISSCGFLNDGQHRCLAVEKSGVSIPAIIIFGVSRESRKTGDQGVARTAGDYLSMSGVANPNNLAAIANMIIQYENHQRFSTGSWVRPTKSEIRNRVEGDIAVELSFLAVRIKGANKVGSNALLGAAHYILSKIDESAADEFFRKLISGTELRERDPIYVAREKLMNPLHRLNVNERAKTIISAWNNWRKGKQVRSITHSMKTGELLPEVV